jgi:hypothetical protein
MKIITKILFFFAITATLSSAFASDIVLTDVNNNPKWRLSVDAVGRLVTSENDGQAWVETSSIEPSTGLANFKHMTINRHPGMPFQKGLSIGTAPKNQNGSAGENYIKMFSNDPLEQYVQINFGMNTCPYASSRYGFWECIEQGVRFVPCVVDPQNYGQFGVGTIPDDSVKMQIRTIESPSSSYQKMAALRIDGGNLANSWERAIQFTGNNGYVVGEITAWISGYERRLRYFSGGEITAESHENGTLTHQ